MFKYTKAELTEKAMNLNFIRDTLEKVYRLADVLAYLHANPLTQNTLALKGGTAINLTILDLPRLSVDIDLDYSENQTREEMMNNREKITIDIKTFMTTQGYYLSEKSKNRHSLDSFVYQYTNLGGMKDNIKIEINYSLRSHIFEPQDREIISNAIPGIQRVYSLVPCEIYASKINALLSRAAARDLYDVYNMIQRNIFTESEYTMLRKSIVFYTAISQEDDWKGYETNRIDSITAYKIKTDLLPVIQKGEVISLDKMKEDVKAFLSELLILDADEERFLHCFAMNEYRPELLFEDAEIVNRLRNHPMALWKMQEH